MNAHSITAIAVSVVLAATLAQSAAAAERVYRWKDKDGVHYGKQAPPGVNAELITVQSGYTAPIEEDTAPKSAETVKAEEDAAFCETATKNFNALSGPGDVKRRDDYGVVTVLTSEQRAAESERAKAAMTQYCKPAAKK